MFFRVLAFGDIGDDRDVIKRDPGVAGYQIDRDVNPDRLSIFADEALVRFVAGKLGVKTLKIDRAIFWMSNVRKGAAFQFLFVITGHLAKRFIDFQKSPGRDVGTRRTHSGGMKKRLESILELPLNGFQFLALSNVLNSAAQAG